MRVLKSHHQEVSGNQRRRSTSVSLVTRHPQKRAGIEKKSRWQHAFEEGHHLSERGADCNADGKTDGRKDHETPEIHEYEKRKMKRKYQASPTWRRARVGAASCGSPLMGGPFFKSGFQLIRINALPRDYSGRLDPFVREKFNELCQAAQITEDY
jgi:hypothetical protein